MSKLKLKSPKLLPLEIEDEELIKSDWKTYFNKYCVTLQPKFEFDVPVFHVYGFAKSYYDWRKKIMKYCVWAEIADTKTSPIDIVATEDYFFNNYEEYLEAIKKVEDDLSKKWKLFIKSLYTIEEEREELLIK